MQITGQSKTAAGFTPAIDTMNKTNGNGSADSLYRQSFNLTATDLQNLQQGFITREMAEKANLRRVDDLQGADYLGRKRKAGESFAGVVFPYMQNGKPLQYRLRLDEPPKVRQSNGELKDGFKYLSAPGAKNNLYFTPNTSPEMLTDSTLPIVITEGEKKTLSLERVATENYTKDKWHFLPLGLSGVWNFRTATKGETIEGEKYTAKGFLPDFEKLAFDGRKVVILFDPNVKTNSDVSAARSELSTELQNIGANVFYAELPQMENVNGIDDLLGLIEREHGTETAIKKGLSIFRSARKPKKSAVIGSDNFELIKTGEKAGVYYKDDVTGRVLICSPLEAVALTDSIEGDNNGILLTWTDLQGRVKKWAMPRKLAHGQSSELIEFLVDRGLEVYGVTQNYHQKIKQYLNAARPQETILCADKIGWHNGVYVLPDETFGTSENPVVFQIGYTPAHNFKFRGTIEEWRENVAKPCVGNSRLVFGVSAGFGASLLPKLNVQGGGFHFRGQTSTGKTTAAKVAGSVWGGSDAESGYCNSWSATANGLESLAERHNHALLCLDEIAQIDAKQAASAAYSLGNGDGKTRMTKTIAVRRSLSWQLLFISTGEISLAQKKEEAGLTTKEGEEIRVLDIPADAEKGHGIFEHLHDFSNGREMSDGLRMATKKYYGSAIRDFLRKYTEAFTNDKDILAAWEVFRSAFESKVSDNLQKHGEGVQRAISRFALVGFAGEIASQLGVTGWQAGEAESAAVIVFRDWLKNRVGRVGSDADKAISQVRHYVQKNRASLFENLNIHGQTLNTGRIIGQAGFRKQVETESGGDDVYYLFFSEVFRKEVCKGFDYTFVCKVLEEKGYLLKSSSGGYQKQLKYKDEHGITQQIRLYWVNSKILNNVENDEQNTND